MGTIPASDNVFDTLRMNEAAAPATPPSAQTVIYTKSDGRIYWKDDAGTEYSVASLDDLSGVANLDDLSDVNAPSPTDGYVLTWDATPGEWVAAAATGGGGGAEDPVADVFGAPTTAFEFDTSSTTGLTALSPTADVLDLDTTVPGHLYVKDNASGTARCGYYASAPSMPFTAIAKLSDANVRADYNQAGLFLGQSTPGTMKYIMLSRAARYIETETGTPTGFTGGITGGVLSDLQTPMYFGIVANSSSDWDFLYSYGGRVWAFHTEAHNAGLTPGSVGVFAAANSAAGFGAAFDFIRIWNSAKAFPGTY